QAQPAFARAERAGDVRGTPSGHTKEPTIPTDLSAHGLVRHQDAIRVNARACIAPAADGPKTRDDGCKSDPGGRVPP
ncbi:MAG: hypothetical protein ACOC0P_05275, partial [Planctomycetota bacterium]